MSRKILKITFENRLRVDYTKYYDNCEHNWFHVSIAGVPFDLVRILRTSFVLRTI